MDEKSINDFKNGLLMVEQLEEFSGRLNKKCKDVLEIAHDPIKLITEGDKLSKSLDGIHFEILLFGNFLEAYNNANNKKEGEEDE